MPMFKPTAVALAMTAMLLTACGSDKSNSTSSADTKDQGSTVVKAPADKDTLVIINGSEPPSLDPQKSQDTTSSDVIRQMMEGLVSTDKDGKTVPGLAEKWETADNKVWKFYLRDAKWSNGDPITAHDAAYALRRLVDPKTGAYYASYLADAKVVGAQDVIDGKVGLDGLGVKALDDKTLEITLSEAVPYFVDMLAHTTTFPVHQKTVETHGEKWVEPANIVVSGAYKLSEWLIGSHLTLERNTGYYNNDKTSIEKVQFLPVTPTSGINRYYTGEVDLTGVPPEHMEKNKSERPEEMHTAPMLCTFYLEPNLTKAPFNDVRVRQALSMTVERDKLIQILKRDITPAYQFTPPTTVGMVDVTPEWAKLDQAARNEEAKKLLAEAGYNAQNPLKFEYLYSTSETGKTLASAFSAMWKQNLDGAVEVEQVNQEWKNFLDTKNQGKFSLTFSGWCADYNEPSSFLNILKTGNSNNTGKYSNAEFDRLMADTLKAGTTPEARQKMYADAERLVVQDNAFIPMYYPIAVRLIKPYVTGFSDTDPLHSYMVKDVAFNK